MSKKKMTGREVLEEALRGCCSTYCDQYPRYEGEIDLGDDYEKVLEDEQKHIREAKRKAVMRFCQQILDANYGRIGVTDFIVCAINYICKECDEV